MFHGYFGDTDMANAAFRASASRPETTAQTRQTVLKDVSAKWGKFSEDDLAALNGRDDLVAQIVTKYGYERIQVQHDVDALLKGREV
jgi:uncharacterized protein YjbJ (UPF0337 family)